MKTRPFGDTFKSIFFNDSGILRSGWRVAAFLFLSTVFVAVGGVFFLMLGKALGGHSTLQIFLGVTLQCAVALAASWICLRSIERLPLSTLGVSLRGQWLTEFLSGLLFGGGTFSLACILAFATGGLTFTLNKEVDAQSLLASMGISFIILSVAAASEELFFRGYFFQTLTRANLSWLAIALTSFVFGLAHVQNPSFTYISLANTVLAGIWFSVAYLKTRALWFPFGMHLMWNWIQGNVFGIEISGLSALSTQSLMNKFENGPVWLSGGDYGIEGGLVCTVALVVSIVGIQILLKSRR